MSFDSDTLDFGVGIRIDRLAMNFVSESPAEIGVELFTHCPGFLFGLSINRAYGTSCVLELLF